ncbi:MarR family transcriptional regulator [Cryobacterium algoricola]|uniref:MarR family transcriptional regulator n=1 Tax=Cryobacterium algoricola TaxID=1259183 RepID=A0ABY2IBB9_9MICO|nr:MarR family transcriptional regulator [Cryobacterium algoricola]TFB85912.1 MarR family transcriptional regulator [Cryobacterium algoricola]
MAEPRKSPLPASAPTGSPAGAPVAAPVGTPAGAVQPLVGDNDIGLPYSGEIGTQLREFVVLSRAFERQVGQALAVNPTDLSAMEHLISAGSLTPSELSRRLDISTAATTLVVDRLVALGHARREAHASDRRKVVVLPAAKSVAMAVGALMPVIGGVATVTRDLPPEERAVIARFLSRVLEVYHGALDGGAAGAEGNGDGTDTAAPRFRPPAS